jgi:hypothetical protein
LGAQTPIRILHKIVQLRTVLSLSHCTESCLARPVHNEAAALRFLFGKQMRKCVTGQEVFRRLHVSDADHRIARDKHGSRIEQHDHRYVRYRFEQ